MTRYIYIYIWLVLLRCGRHKLIPPVALVIIFFFGIRLCDSGYVVQRISHQAPIWCAINSIPSNLEAAKRNASRANSSLSPHNHFVLQRVTQLNFSHIVCIPGSKPILPLYGYQWKRQLETVTSFSNSLIFLSYSGTTSIYVRNLKW